MSEISNSDNTTMMSINNNAAAAEDDQNGSSSSPHHEGAPVDTAPPPPQDRREECPSDDEEDAVDENQGLLDNKKKKKNTTVLTVSTNGGGGEGGMQRYGSGGSGSSSPGSPTRDISPYSQDRTNKFDAALALRKAKNAKASKALCGAIVFCFCFMIAEGVGGVIAHSLAVLTDAAHMLTDVAALSLALFAMHMSHRPASNKYSYGWHRAEAVGALGSVFTIWALVGAILVSAVQRIVDQTKCASDANRSGCEGVAAPIMLGIGIGGLAANMCTACILDWGGHHGHSHGSHGHSHGGGHGHSHGGGHGHAHGASHDDTPSVATTSCVEEEEGQQGKTLTHRHSHDDHGHGGGESSTSCTEGEEANKDKKKKAKKNLNMRGAFLHALGDCIQSIGVILAGGVIWAYNKHMYNVASYEHSWVNLADPCCSILFGVVTLYTTVGLFRDLLKILMEGVPGDISYSEVNDALWDIPAVDSVHDLHIWSLTAENVVLSVHLIVDHEDTVNAPCVLRRAQEVCAKFHIEHTTIQLDSLDINVSRCGTESFVCAN